MTALERRIIRREAYIKRIARGLKKMKLAEERKAARRLMRAEKRRLKDNAPVYADRNVKSHAELLQMINHLREEVGDLQDRVESLEHPTKEIFEYGVPNKADAPPQMVQP